MSEQLSQSPELPKLRCEGYPLQRIDTFEPGARVLVFFRQQPHRVGIITHIDKTRQEGNPRVLMQMLSLSLYTGPIEVLSLGGGTAALKYE